MSAVKVAIDAANKAFVMNVERQDAAGLAGLYTSGGCVMPTNSDIVSGADSIQAFWQGVFAMGIRGAVLETIDLDEHRDTVIETGRYTLKADGDAVADQGKYLVVWKKEGGSWKLHKDIFNTSQPAA